MDGGLVMAHVAWLEAIVFAPAATVVLWSIGRALHDRRRTDNHHREAT